MNPTSISWVLGPDGKPGFTWNPLAGCSAKPISKGCDHCWAAGLASTRLAHKDGYRGLARDGRWTGEVRFFPRKLAEPLQRRKPAGIFVGDMGDVALLPFEQIAAIFGVMAACPQHRFYLLTKRPGRLREWFAWMGEQGRDLDGSRNRREVLASAYADQVGDGSEGDRDRAFWMLRDRILEAHFEHDTKHADSVTWPLPNVWIGTSVCTQEDADRNIPELLQIPAAARFLSCEPLLEEIDIGLQKATCKCCPRWSSRWVGIHRTVRSDVPFGDYGTIAPGIYRASSNPHGALSCVSSNGKTLGIRPAEFTCLPGLDWVIVGGESGPAARPCNVEHILSIVEQCAAAGVPVFVKQLGANCITRNDDNFTADEDDPDYPKWPDHLTADGRVVEVNEANRYQGAPVRIRTRDRSGADMSEWRSDLRVREMPEVGR